MKQFLKYDWDAIAGIIAAVAAIIMHMLHLVEADVLLTIAVVLIALLFLRDLRRERQAEHLDASVLKTEVTVQEILSRLNPPDAVLVGPLSIHQVMEDFSRRARNEMVWFHVCPVMFKRQALFDALLKTAIDNPAVKSIQFVLDHSDHDLWESEVVPKIKQCPGQGKVKETIRTSLLKLQSEHEAIGDAVHKIHHLAKDYAIPADVCNTFTVTYEKLKEFEADLHKHVHLENNILFAKAAKL